MAVATGTQIRPELSAVDYTPIAQAAGQAAQMQLAGAQALGKGIMSVGASVGDAIQQYEKNKAANAVLEGENAAMLRRMAGNPQISAYAPDQATLGKYTDKLVKGGLSLSENKKLNAELNTAYKLFEADSRMAQQQLYAEQARAGTERMKFELDQAKRERSATDQFNLQLQQLTDDERTAEKIFDIGVQLGAPASVVNAAVGGKLNIGQFELSREVQKANKIRNDLEVEQLQRQLDAAKATNPDKLVELIDRDGVKVLQFTDNITGKKTFDVVKLPTTKPTTAEQLSSAVQMYRMGASGGNSVLTNAAIADYAEAMGYKGPGWSTDQIGDELAKLASKVPVTAAPAAGGAGIRSAKPVTAEQKAPGVSPAPAAPSATPAPVKAKDGKAVSQPQLPPQPTSPPPFEQVVMNTEQALAAAPQAPVVDTNLFVEPPPATAPRPSARPLSPAFNYPAMSVLGGAERLARALGPVEQQIAAPGRLLNELGRYGGAALTGVFTGDYSLPEQGIVDTASEGMARLLSGSNAAGETVRALGMPFGMVPEGVGQAVFDQPTNSIQATMEALSSGMRPSRGGAQPAQPAAAPRPMQSAELPQIELSKDAKRIANMLLQEYENNKGGKPPTFTITATSPGGKETSIKLSNPEILAVMSNPTNFGGIIRGGQEAFTRQNAEMNRIMQEMLAARQMELARRRANRAR
jgi:hypothetical protein